MGVPSLWNVLEPVKKSESLLNFASEHRRQAQSAGVGGNAFMQLGVDMGTCMAECNAGALAAGVHSQHAGGGLYIFYKKLVGLLRIPAHFVFVFDGHARPPVKRGHRVQFWRAIWWADLSVELIKAFGYETHDAPAEAEAELSKLNIEGYIQGVIMSDSDACLFGTKVLLRTIPKKDQEYPDEYFLYETNAGLPLTHEGLVLFALLCGGDYAKGVDGFGSAIAFALAQCGFGEQLVQAFRTLHDKELDEFYVQWRCNLQAELISNSFRFLGIHRPILAAAIPNTFPDHRILDLYLNPITSWSPGWTPPNPARWKFRQPCIPKITSFCSEHFLWQDPNVIKLKFKEHLWEGICLQMLYSPSIRYMPEQRRLQLPKSLYVDIVKISYQIRRGQFYLVYGDEPQPRVLVSMASLIDSMGPDFNGHETDRAVIWPPASLLSQVLMAHQEDEGIPQASSSSIPTPPASAVGSHTTSDEAAGWVQLGEKHWFIDLTK